MKTLQDIKDQIAIEIGKKSWSNMLHNYGSASDSLLDLVAKRYAFEVAKEALKNASGVVDYYVSKDHQFYHEAKESILDESNIPQL